MYKLIALDLDGTLLTDDKRITDRTLQALHRCQRAGAKVVTASARSVGYSREYIDAARADAVVACGGALALVGERVVYRCLLSSEDSARITRLALANGAGRVLFDGETSFRHNDDTLTDPFGVEHFWDFSIIPSDATYKINASFHSPAPALAIAAAVPACTVIGYAGEDHYRFAHRDATKAHALRAVADALGITPSEVAAFGDDAIDLEMLHFAGLGVAMGNAVAEAKAAADAVTLSNEEDGVAHYLEWLLAAGLIGCVANQ